MSLGLGTSLTKGGLATPGIVTDSLVLKHNYAAGGVVPVSDGAVHLDGTGDYINIGTGIDLGSTTDFTIACWAKTDDWTSEMVMGKWQNGAYRWYLGGDGSDYLNFYSLNNSNGGVTYTGTTALTNGEWTHIAFVADRSAHSKGYINGVLDDTDTTENRTLDLDNTGVLTIGASGGDGSSPGFFTGYICNVGIWAGALTQAQIKSIMWKNYAGLTDSEKDAGDTGTPNLVSWWNLDEGEGTTANDSHGSNDGSATFT